MNKKMMIAVARAEENPMKTLESFIKKTNGLEDGGMKKNFKKALSVIEEKTDGSAKAIIKANMKNASVLLSSIDMKNLGNSDKSYFVNYMASLVTVIYSKKRIYKMEDSIRDQMEKVLIEKAYEIQSEELVEKIKEYKENYELTKSDKIKKITPRKDKVLSNEDDYSEQEVEDAIKRVLKEDEYLLRKNKYLLNGLSKTKQKRTIEIAVDMYRNNELKYLMMFNEKKDTEKYEKEKEMWKKELKKLEDEESKRKIDYWLEKEKKNVSDKEVKLDFLRETIKLLIQKISELYSFDQIIEKPKKNSHVKEPYYVIKHKKEWLLKKEKYDVLLKAEDIILERQIKEQYELQEVIAYMHNLMTEVEAEKEDYIEIEKIVNKLEMLLDKKRKKTSKLNFNKIREKQLEVIMREMKAYIYVKLKKKMFVEGNEDDLKYLVKKFNGHSVDDYKKYIEKIEYVYNIQKNKEEWLKPIVYKSEEKGIMMYTKSYENHLIEEIEKISNEEMDDKKIVQILKDIF